MKKIAVLLTICMMSIAMMPAVSAVAQPKDNRPLAASGKDKDKGNGKGNADNPGQMKKEPGTQKAPGEKGPPKENNGNGAKNKEAKKIKGNSANANQGAAKKGKYVNQAPTYKNGVIVSTNLTVTEIRPLAVSYGLVGYQPLPPGIRKNLMRGKPLPPGIAKKMYPVPRVLLVELPYYSGYEWRVVGSDLVLLALATATVIDILSDIFD